LLKHGSYDTRNFICLDGSGASAATSEFSGSNGADFLQSGYSMSKTLDSIEKSEWDAKDPRVISIAGESVVTIGPVEVGPGAEILVHNDPQGVLADRCRFLRANLRPLWSEEKLKSLLITSPFPHDGKSTVALNLAIVLAERGTRKVLLIEADLHHPTLTKRLGLEHHKLPGFAECLEGAMSNPLSAIRRVEPIGIHLLPAGSTNSHPTELLQSDAVLRIMRSFREHFDWVLVDSPPVKPLSDALLLRQRTDATLLVIRAGRTLSTAVDEAVALLGKKNILGMVLNGVEGIERTYSRYYGSYGGNRHPKK
jgi:capsular exopolysaccharide synthesis family protein